MDDDSLLKFFKLVGRLKRMPRMGWLVAGIPKQIVESVAEHVMRTTIIAITFCQDLSSKGVSLNCGKVALISIVHDLPESIFMDVGGEAREIIGKEKRVRYEKEGFDLLLSSLSDKLRGFYKALWEEYEKQNTLEALIVYLADKMEMFLQAYEYLKIGVNKELLKEFFGDLKKVYDIIAQEDKLRPLHSYFEQLRQLFENS